MLNNIVRWVIERRWLVLLGTIALIVWTIYIIPKMPLDVLPAFAPPQVEIQTEAPGLAPEEVETLVTLPIESAVNGTPGVTAVRSSSAAGNSAVRVVFDWSTDNYRARQLVAERLQQAVTKLPQGVEVPQIAPQSSPVGLVVQYAFTVAPNSSETLMEVRRLVDGQITNRLLATPGVSQVLAFGGQQRQYQVLVDPAKLTAANLTLEQVTTAARGANLNATGGYLITQDREQLVRGLGRIESITDLQQSTIVAKDGVPVRLQDVAEVQIGAAIQRGDGSFNGRPAVIVMVNKQPLVDTPTVAKAVDVTMSEIKRNLPTGIQITTTFQQNSYINSSVQNVVSSLAQGSLIASCILIPFLMNWRTLTVCLLDFVLSLLFSMLILSWLGIGLNTMTLGGLTVAIGTAIDDAIVYGENTYRRLRENYRADETLPALEIIFRGSEEVRESLLGATIIGIIVFSPIFTLPGVEGRIFTPMGIAYLVVVVTSSLESLLISPALCALLLPGIQMRRREPLIPRLFKRFYAAALRWSFRSAIPLIAVSMALMVATVMIIPTFGRLFLPEFQEQTMVNTLTLYPGSSLAATSKSASVVENILQKDKRFQFVQTRAGRAFGDAEAPGVNLVHIDVELSAEGMKNRSKTIARLREIFNSIPGVSPNVGGFLSHRMDEVLSGVRSAIAIKIAGPDLVELRKIGEGIEAQMKTVAGIVDLSLEQQIPIAQVQIKFDRVAASRYGLSVANVAQIIETALSGQRVSQVVDRQQFFDLVVWLKPEARQNIQSISNLLVNTPSGVNIPLSAVAKVEMGQGPNTISHENVSRSIVASANAKDRDLRSIVREIEEKVKKNVTLPTGYLVSYEGQFEAEERATQNILFFGFIALIGITVLTYLSVKSIPSTLAIIINIPIGLIGGVLAIALTGGTLSIASMVGFVSLFGVAMRNGLLLVDNYNTKHELGMPLVETIITGSMERLNAIIMTALTSALGLAPTILQNGPGQELLQPLSVVVFGGLFTSTAITLVILPALYIKFGTYLLPRRDVAAVDRNEVGQI
jgi:CzcA family heavy metal efflux pump